jgi:hypothetical protein
MNVKIQGGGGGTYANTGSCTGVVTYLQHEDLERIRQGQQAEPFFNQSRDYISPNEVTYKIDHNRAQLHKTDAKFFVITVSPSEKELAAMGGTQEQQARAMKEYIRKDVIPTYAENFNKGLQADNIEYYAKIHFNRNDAGVTDMHAHIIVSRKDRSNTMKLSPKTNHRSTGKGAVKGGFDRTEFFRKCEAGFDLRTNYRRDIKESFEYLNAMKNGTPAEIQKQALRAVQYQAKREAEKEITNKVAKKIVKGIGGRGL